MAVLIALPILGGMLILQSAVVNQAPLLHGAPDLVLLVIIAWALQKRVRTAWQWAGIAGLLAGFVSALPFGVYLFNYLAAVGLAILLRQRVWQAPLFAMLVITFFSTLLEHVVTILALRISGEALPLLTAFNQVVFPSMLLNLLIAAPIYPLVADLANLFYPEPLES
jgi:rod shape-determining protein MreD